LQGFAFVVIHTFLGRAAGRYGSPFVRGRFGPVVLTALPSVWSSDPHNDAITVFSPSRG
jgi:hypothetical protein